MNSPVKSAEKQPKKPTKPRGKGAKNSAKSSKKKDEQKPAPSQASVIVELVRDVGARLFRTPSNEAYVVLPVNGHNEVFKLLSPQFRGYLNSLMYSKLNRVLQAQAVTEAIATLDGKALHDQGTPTHQVHWRVARVDDTVYVDLANEHWQVVEIDAEGWRVQNRSPVMFVRPNSMLPMAAPEVGGDLDDIRKLVNCGSDEDFLLMCAWILGAFNPKGPFPILCIHGQQGSGKSTTCELLRSLIDPSVSPHRSLPHSDRDLWIGATLSHLQSFDNVSAIPEWMSDALCRVATGGSYAIRKHFSDTDEQVFTAIRPILLNGIPDAAVKSDLVDRCIILNLPTIRAEQRITKSEWSERSERSFPKIMGAIFNAVSRSIKGWNSMDTTKLSRMADFEQWVIAAELPTTDSGCDFQTAYERNRQEINSTILSSSPLAGAIKSLIHEEHEFQGTATQLMEKLKLQLNLENHTLPGWVKATQTLSGELKRIAPNLSKADIEVTFDSGRDSANCKLIRIATVSEKDRSER